MKYFSNAPNNWKLRNYPREKILIPQNTKEKKSWTHEIPTRKKFGTHEIYTKKKFEPTKYPPRHDDTMELDPRDTQLWHPTHEI